MPSWSDDAGNCHFDVGGVPCYESKTGCPMHRGDWVWHSPTKTTRKADIDAAFQRGVSAMREAAAISLTCHFPTAHTDGTRCGLCTLCEGNYAQHIRNLPNPKDKP